MSDNGEALKSGVTVPTSPKGKYLDRRSRSGKGRGLPKKGWCTEREKGIIAVVLSIFGILLVETKSLLLPAWSLLVGKGGL